MNINEQLEKYSSRWALTSGTNEAVSDGVPGKYTPFAEALLSILEDTNRPIGVQELSSRVLEKVAASATQTPRSEPLPVKGHKNGQFVFHPKTE